MNADGVYLTPKAGPARSGACGPVNERVLLAARDLLEEALRKAHERPPHERSLGKWTQIVPSSQLAGSI